MGILSKILGAVATPFLGPLGPALIGAGSSLLGGALSNKAERKGIEAQNAYNDPAQIRARAEAAGFNPLLFLGPGVGNQNAAASGAYMGAAVADAGMQIADQMSKNRELARLEKLSAENKKLAEKVQSMTIRPKVGGVYAQREETPLIGPQQPIRVRHAITGKWYNLDPGVAKRLKLEAGDTLMVEDFEAIGGEIYGEIAGTTAMADSTFGTGDRAFPPDQLITRPNPKPTQNRAAAPYVPRWNNSRPMFGGGF
jgi:hypothetical protein